MSDGGPDGEDTEESEESAGALEGLTDLFSGGMPDLGSLVGSLGAVQQLQEAEYEGRAGGGLVVIKANGRMDVGSVTISPDALGDGADVELLADLVLAALHDLTAQIAAAQQRAMGSLGLL